MRVAGWFKQVTWEQVTSCVAERLQKFLDSDSRLYNLLPAQKQDDTFDPDDAVDALPLAIPDLGEIPVQPCIFAESCSMKIEIACWQLSSYQF